MANKFDSIVPMKHSVAVYVPSNDKGVAYDNSADVKFAQIMLSKLFGGASAVSVQGAWVSGEELVNEDVVKVYAFADALSDQALDAVWGCAKLLQIERHQDSVGVEIDGAFYLIE